MKLLKKLILTLAFAPALALASGGSFPLDRAPERTTDLAALQNGAKLFVNYCLNCHSAVSMRYNRLRDIGLTEDQIKSNLLFTGEKIGELMKTSLSAKDAKEWFGAVPPDLSVIARAVMVEPDTLDEVMTRIAPQVEIDLTLALRSARRVLEQLQDAAARSR